MPGIHELSVTTLVKLIRKRELMVSELLDAYIRRIDIVNPKINALINTNFNAARQTAFEADQKLKNSNFLPCLSKAFTLILTYRFTWPYVPGTDKQPSSSQVIFTPERDQTGLIRHKSPF